MDTDHIIRKLELQSEPTMLFTDLDGTLFSSNANIITAPIFNSQTAAILAKRHIPFIIVTGRSFWRKIDQYHLKLLGLPKPDAVITANGTIIYVRQKENFISDFAWQGIMQSTKIADSKGHIKTWNKWEITNTITDYFDQNNLIYQLGQGNTYLIRLRLSNYDIKKVEQIRKDILTFFPKGIRFILTEKLLWKNTETIFSGELLITPATAGKDKAVAYFLKQVCQQLGNPIHALIFGDATIDVPMLTMKADASFTLSQYAVHPTPLAKKAVERIKDNPHLHMLFEDGPKEILWTLRPELKPKKSSSLMVHGSQKDTKTYEPSNQELTNQFSPAQNNKFRQIIRVFEGMLDTLVDKNLSPNEISFLGLEKLSQGLALLHKPKSSFVDKTQGMYHYTFGNLTDILDGIRARNSNKKEENGQLVDGFADRAKEFMQLFARAKSRIAIDEEQAMQTLLSALSCVLPSIARAQVEISGKTVSERDEKGGSMIDRTRRLFLSLIFYTLGNDDQSYATDIKILETNLATFQHRLSSLRGTKQSLEIVISNEHEKSQFSDFQKKALERWLLYIDVLQQEDKVIKKILAKHPTLLKEYEKESETLTKKYLELPTNKLRGKWKIKDYKLQMKDYL